MRKIFVMMTILGVAACATVAKQAFQDPVVSFKDLQVQGVGVTGGTLDVVLSVYNPNGYRLDATRLTYRLMVDTTTIGEGINDNKFTIQNGDSTTIHLPITVNYAGLSTAGKELLGKGSVDYRVMGDVTVATSLGNFTRPYDQAGRFTTFGGMQRR